MTQSVKGSPHKHEDLSLSLQHSTFFKKSCQEQWYMPCLAESVGWRFCKRDLVSKKGGED